MSVNQLPSNIIDKALWFADTAAELTASVGLDGDAAFAFDNGKAFYKVSGAWVWVPAVPKSFGAITSEQAATALTTVLTGGSINVPANFLTVGLVVKLVAIGAITKTTSPPTITSNLNVGGSSRAALVTTQASSATTFGFVLEGYVTVRTAGSGGTAVSSLHIRYPGGSTVQDQLGAVVNTATFALDTTIARLFSIDMKMTTGVASNILKIEQSWVSVE